MPIFRSQGEMFGSKSWVFFGRNSSKARANPVPSRYKDASAGFGSVFAENLGFPEEVFR